MTSSQYSEEFPDLLFISFRKTNNCTAGARWRLRPEKKDTAKDKKLTLVILPVDGAQSYAKEASIPGRNTHIAGTPDITG